MTNVLNWIALGVRSWRGAYGYDKDGDYTAFERIDGTKLGTSDFRMSESIDRNYHVRIAGKWSARDEASSKSALRHLKK
jgi:hypothetical protein